jgi:PAS domain S-box-containing protein
MDRDPLHARRLFELSLDLLVVADGELRVLHANPAWERVLGYRPDEVEGRTLPELMHPDDIDRTARDAGVLLTGGASVTFDNRFRHADGSVRWMRWSARSDPETGLIYAAGRDASAEVRAAASADVAVARLEAAQRVAHMGSFEFDVRTQRVFYTREMYRLYGLDPNTDEPLWQPELQARAVEEDRARVEELLDTAMRTGGPVSGDFRMVHAPERILHAIVEVEHDADGQATVGRGTIQDVTELRAAEAQRRASERRLAEAERIAGLGVVEWCPADGKVEWSDGMYRLFGLPPDQPPPSEEEFYARMLPDEARRSREAVAQAMATLGTWEVDYHVVDAQGRLRAVQVRGEAYMQQGAVWLRASVQDVTQARRQAEQQAEVARLAQLALAGGDRDAFFREVCATVSRTLDTTLSAIAEVHGDGTAVAVAGVGWAPGVQGAVIPPGDSSLSRIAVNRNEPLIVDDWHAEERYPYSFALRQAGVRSTAMIPIAGHERPFGVLATNSREPGALEPLDVAFLEAVAAILATAIERFRSEAEIAELAAVRGRLVAESLEAEERVRRGISEDLHDGVLQDLLAARQDLVEAEQGAGGRNGADGMVSSARAGVERSVARLREAVHALHPVVLQHGGLLPALQAAADQAARQGGFSADVSVVPDAAGARDELLLSAARELLSNAAKHAAATRVEVTVWREGDQLRLEVGDDGRGVDMEAMATAPLRGHIGLAALTQRIEAAGGSVEVMSHPGSAGTIVSVAVPVA